MPTMSLVDRVAGAVCVSIEWVELALGVVLAAITSGNGTSLHAETSARMQKASAIDIDLKTQHMYVLQPVGDACSSVYKHREA
jgi:hypothetical protein